MTRDELLAALAVERQDNRWWKAPEPEPEGEITFHRRRRHAQAEADRVEARNKREAA